MVFSNGESMLKKLDLHPDIIILDYHLDSLDQTAKNGREILEILQERIPGIPVIMLSSSKDTKSVIHLLKYGATDYIIKDDNFFENLSKTIRHIVETSTLQSEIKSLKSKYKKGTARITLVIISGILLLISLLIFLS